MALTLLPSKPRAPSKSTTTRDAYGLHTGLDQRKTLVAVAFDEASAV
jgi:hypothetical protein